MTGVEFIDFHAHVLPGADHGSDSLTTSLSQLSLARDAGVKRLVATPHFYPHRHTLEFFLQRREKAYSALLPHLSSDLPLVIPGAEVLICPGIDHMNGIEKLCIGESDTILIELPFSDFDDSYCDAAYNLSKKGMNVVLAHADRYPKENVEKMIKAGAKIQLNASGLCTLFKRKHLYKWIESDLVVALGSDVHGVDRTAYSKFIKAIERIPAFVEGIMIKSAECLNVNEYKKAE